MGEAGREPEAGRRERSDPQRATGYAGAWQRRRDPMGELPGVLESTRRTTLSGSRLPSTEPFMTLGTWGSTESAGAEKTHPLGRPESRAPRYRTPSK